MLFKFESIKRLQIPDAPERCDPSFAKKADDFVAFSKDLVKAINDGFTTESEAKPIKLKWLDMESAPRDGTVIIVHDPKPSAAYGPDIHTAHYDSDHGSFVASDDVDTDPYDIDPSGWIPLPE